ncbi:MAG: hypothetical protein WDA75_24650, partial [Candidatus Latescibacterota bacterium]
MNKQELHEVIGHLEALDSLATLFSRLWFDKVKEEVRNDKTRAYLMVFDDAFPGLNQVIGFVKGSAQAMAQGDVDEVRNQFEVLSQQLLQREIETDLSLEDEVEVDESVFEEEDSEPGVSSDQLTEEERDALETVEQKDLDRLFASRPSPPKQEPDIDALFSRQATTAKGTKASRQEIEEFLAAEAESAEDDAEVADDAEEEVSLEELLAAEEEAVSTEDEDAADEVDEAEEEDEAEEVAGEEAEEEELDLAGLLGEEEEEEESAEAAEEEDEVDLDALLA